MSNYSQYSEVAESDKGRIASIAVYRILNSLARKDVASSLSSDGVLERQTN